MEELKGTYLPKLPIENLFKVSDLIYFEGPLLSHFQNSKGENYLFYWVDMDEKFNRWLIFRINSEALTFYINGSIPLLQLIKEPADGFLFKVDIDILNYNQVQIVLPIDLPKNYLPNPDSLYAFKNQTEELDLAIYSTKYNSGILQAYFQNSSKVPYNEINIHLFGPAMYSLHEITSGLSKSYIKRRIDSAPRDKNGKPNIDRAALKLSTQLNYFAQAGGSFSALFKPASKAIQIEGFKTDEDMFIAYVMEFINASENYEKLFQFVRQIDKKIINSYKHLLNTIIASKLKFYLRYENTISKISEKQTLNYDKAEIVIGILEKMVFDDKYEVKMTGRFIMAHTKTGQYIIEDIEDSENISRGKLDKDRLEVAWKINFSKIYDVTIERRESKQAGNKKSKIEDLLVSFIER